MGFPDSSWYNTKIYSPSSLKSHQNIKDLGQKCKSTFEKIPGGICDPKPQSMKMEEIWGRDKIICHKGRRAILHPWTVGISVGSTPQVSTFPHL